MATFDDVTIKVEGLAALQEALKRLDQEVAKKAVRRSLYAGAKVIQGLARQKAPREKGDLAKGIEISTRAWPEKGIFTAKVRPSKKPRGKNKKRIAPIYEALWNEFGVQAHEEAPTSKKALAFEDKAGGKLFRKAIHHPGIAPHPFMRPAADEGWPKALDVFKETLREGIEDAVKK